eukprot:GHVN01022762.1.p1 GENE.GHVN01022762.1~~GHVN01022762.1.p1  ORF type:complete len:308 (-),score=24.14 GHVN01022762.1:1301-2224(-)
MWAKTSQGGWKMKGAKPRCCACNSSADPDDRRCIRCACAKSGKGCTNCRPSEAGQCICSSRGETTEPPTRKLTEWESRWKQLAVLQTQSYDPPDGSVGRRIVSALTSEIKLLAEGKSQSDRLMCFPALILRKTWAARKANEIRAIISLRIDMLEKNQYDELVDSAVQEKKGVLRSKSTDPKAVLSKAAGLVRKEKIREAGRLISDGYGVGIHAPDGAFVDVDGVKTSVRDILHEKHPAPQPFTLPQSSPTEPHYAETLITSAHVCKAGRRLHGSAGPGGKDAQQLKRLLFKYGASSERLRRHCGTRK